MMLVALFSNLPRKKTLYIAGDTICSAELDVVSSTHKPDIVALNAGFAQLLPLVILLWASIRLFVHMLCYLMQK